MAQIDVKWDYPLFSSYSVLSAAWPGVCWNDPYTNPLIKEFRVQMLLVEDDKWVDLGHTAKDYMRVDAGDYTLKSSYQIRIATIGVNRRQSPWAYSQVFIASPLRFDFTAADVVRLPDGQSKRNQRLLFLLF